MKMEMKEMLGKEKFIDEIWQWKEMKEEEVKCVGRSVRTNVIGGGSSQF